MKPKIKRPGLRPKVHVILERAVEDGIRRGYGRAHKHTDSPSEESLITSIYAAVMGDIYEVFDIEGEDLNGE